jgi:phosphoglycolate phosphatase
MSVAPLGPVVGFDLDMTLVDSVAGIAATLRVALGELGRTVTDEQVWPTVGIPLEDALASFMPDVDAAAVTRRYRELYPDHGVAPITLLPGVVEAFEAVQRAGGRVLVVSAKAEFAVRAVLAHVGLDVPALRPDRVAGGLFGAAKGVVLREEQADVYVGDHPGDVAAARAAGAIAVAVATGPHTAEQLHEAGADVVLADLRQLPAWLRENRPETRRTA